MAQETPIGEEPLSTARERQRLEFRDARLAAVLRALRGDERGYRRRDREIPRQLTQVVRDFERNRRAVQARLRQLDR